MGNRKQPTRAEKAHAGKMGRPTLYRDDYCQMLEEHMKGGGSFEAFASRVNVHEQTLYNWLEEYNEFFESKKRGVAHLRQFWENLGKGMAMGQLRQLKSEKPIIGKDGEPIIGPDGQVMMHREYEHVSGNATALVWVTKNILGWKDKTEINLTGKDGGPIVMTDTTTEDLKQELAKLQGEAKKYFE